MTRRIFTTVAALLMLAATQNGLIAEEFYMGGDGDKDGKACDTCGPTSNLYVGFEAAVLKPHLGSLGFSGFGHPSAQITPTFDYEFSPRIWLGWENSEGLGVRATYWQMDAEARESFFHADDLNLPGLGIGLGLDAQTFDIEATQRGCWGSMAIQVGGGLRYGKMQTELFAYNDNPQAPFSQAGLAAEFEGIGPTIALDVRRAIGSRGLSLVGGVRGSWLYGTTDAFATGELTGLLGDLTVTAEDHMMQVYEVGLGVEWATTFANGNQLTAGLMWEAQAWEWSPVASLLHQDIGLTGPAFSISYLR